jgi:hypothetical protein
MLIGIIAASALSDLILAIYPLFTIKNLQMPPKVKFGLGFVLSLGIMFVLVPVSQLIPNHLTDITSRAMIAAIVKTTNLYTLTSAHDRPWTMVPLTAWVAVEQYLIIIAACIPALTPLFNIIIRHRGSKRSRSRSKSGSKSLPLHSHRRKRSAVNAADGHQAYLPFASVGREFVEYPMTWAGSKGGGGRYGSGSVVTGSGRDSGSFVGVEDGGSEVGITSKGHQSVGSAVGVGLGVGEEGGMQGGILRTTEFRIKEVVRYDGVG